MIAKKEALAAKVKKVFRGKTEGKGELFTIGVDDRSPGATKKKDCLINYKIDEKYTSEHIGRKLY